MSLCMKVDAGFLKCGYFTGGCGTTRVQTRQDPDTPTNLCPHHFPNQTHSSNHGYWCLLNICKLAGKRHKQQLHLHLLAHSAPPSQGVTAAGSFPPHPPTDMTPKQSSVSSWRVKQRASGCVNLHLLNLWVVAKMTPEEKNIVGYISLFNWLWNVKIVTFAAIWRRLVSLPVTETWKWCFGLKAALSGRSHWSLTP